MEAVLAIAAGLICFMAVIFSKPKYQIPTIEDLRSSLSSIKNGSLKGTKLIKEGVLVRVVLHRGRSAGLTVVSSRSASEHPQVFIPLNSKSNCRDLARAAVAELKSKT